MIPSTFTAYVHQPLGHVRGGLAPTSLPPMIAPILRTALSLEIAFVTAAGTVEELAADAEGRLVVKEQGDPAGTALLLDTAWTRSGSGESTRYTFGAEVDSADLRASLGRLPKKCFTAQILITIPGDSLPSSSREFPFWVHNNFNRTADAAPIVSRDVSLVLNADGNAFEAFVNGESVGFIPLRSTDF